MMNKLKFLVRWSRISDEIMLHQVGQLHNSSTECEIQTFRFSVAIVLITAIGQARSPFGSTVSRVILDIGNNIYLLRHRYLYEDSECEANISITTASV